MRKFLVLTALVAVGGVASASFIVAPFILDNGVSAAGSIGIFNLTADPLEVGVIYNDGSQFRTPAENTFELGGNSSIGWHPGTNNPASEGADNPAPNMTAFRDISGDGDSNNFSSPLALRISSSPLRLFSSTPRLLQCLPARYAIRSSVAAKVFSSS